jgi:hypothetical protein
VVGLYIAQVDQETIYAPRHGNDRLLLGLKVALMSTDLLPVCAHHRAVDAYKDCNSIQCFDVCQMHFPLVYHTHLNILRSFL